MDNTCSFPANDYDIDGIYRFLCWEAKNAGLSSNVFHYLEVLKKSALTEDHPQFENFIRAFWRRIEPYKNKYEKELPEKLPIEFLVNMTTARVQLLR